MDTYPDQPDGDATTNQHPAPAGVHIVGGIHAGAVIPVSTQDPLLIGAGEDCDVILSDPGVGAHHCMLSARGAKVAFRPIDDVVLVNGRRYAPGEPTLVAVGGRAQVGSALLEIVTAADLIKGSAHQSWRLRRVRRSVWALLRRQYRWGIAVVLAVAVACQWRSANPQTSMNATYVPSGAMSDSPAQPSGHAAAALAHDVAEVLRLSGISGDARDDGNGTVVVHGHLGDPLALEKVVQSRAMREITGLKRISAVNLDQPAAPSAATGDTTWLVRVIPSKDPYVIATDGSRYYLGATLPHGGRLAGVQEGEILVDRDGQVEHVRLLGSPPRS